MGKVGRPYPGSIQLRRSAQLVHQLEWIITITNGDQAIEPCIRGTVQRDIDKSDIVRTAWEPEHSVDEDARYVHRWNEGRGVRCPGHLEGPVPTGLCRSPKQWEHVLRTVRAADAQVSIVPGIRSRVDGDRYSCHGVGAGRSARDRVGVRAARACRRIENAVEGHGGRWWCPGTVQCRCSAETVNERERPLVAAHGDGPARARIRRLVHGDRYCCRCAGTWWRTSHGVGIGSRHGRSGIENTTERRCGRCRTGPRTGRTWRSTEDGKQVHVGTIGTERDGCRIPSVRNIALEDGDHGYIRSAWDSTCNRIEIVARNIS